MDKRSFLSSPAMVVACLAPLLAAWLWAAAPASAATQTWGTPGSYDWVVPAGVTSATFDLFGGSGSGAGASIGGKGGETVATIAVTPGETLQINVGVGDPVGQVGGSGFGGEGSDVRQGGTAVANRVLVAGAGGGAGGPVPSNGGSGGDGGNGGGLVGTPGAVGQDGAGQPPHSGGCEGRGGTQTAGGLGGGGTPGEQCVVTTGNYSTNGDYQGIGNGGPGGPGGGGMGGYEAGGSGGGGYHGGGGGSGSTSGGGGGGGGGSSFAEAGATSVSMHPGVNRGNGQVTVTYGGGATAVVSSVVLNAGSTAGGNTVTINGANFASGASVKFGSTASGLVTFVSTTRLKAVAPAHASGVVNVTVKTANGTSATSSKDLYAYGRPTVSSFSPASGDTGDLVTINGKNFVPRATVKFATKTSALVTFVSPTQLKAVVPSGAVAGKISVVTPAGTGTSQSKFTPTP